MLPCIPTAYFWLCIGEKRGNNKQNSCCYLSCENAQTKEKNPDI